MASITFNEIKMLQNVIQPLFPAGTLLGDLAREDAYRLSTYEVDLVWAAASGIMAEMTAEAARATAKH